MTAAATSAEATVAPEPRIAIATASATAARFALVQSM
jgi:hypothetical protein